MTSVRRTAVLLALLAPAGLGEDHAEARDGDVLDRVYGWIGKHHFRTPDGGRIVVPFDPGFADELRARLPEEHREPERLAKTHVAYLARAPKVAAQRLALARLALATTPRAVIHVLKQRAWRDLDLAGKRQLASVLASSPALGAAELFAADPDVSDPVLLVALMVKTGHTFGAPPRFLLAKDRTIPAGVRKHWKRWMKKTWPDLAWKPLEERRKLEHEAIGKLRQSEEPEAKERARLRHAAGRTLGLSAFARWLARPAKKRANLDEATRDRLPGAWFTTYPSYGP